MRGLATWAAATVFLGGAAWGCAPAEEQPEVGDAEREVIADAAHVAGAALVAAALAETVLGLGQLDIDADLETNAGALSAHATETLPDCADVTGAEPAPWVEVEHKMS